MFLRNLASFCKKYLFCSPSSGPVKPSRWNPRSRSEANPSPTRGAKYVRAAQTRPRCIPRRKRNAIGLPRLRGRGGPSGWNRAARVAPADPRRTFPGVILSLSKPPRAVCRAATANLCRSSSPPLPYIKEQSPGRPQHPSKLCSCRSDAIVYR
jgi:hypothetical protein